MNTMNFSPTIKQSSKIGPQLGVSFRYISEKYFKSICGLLVELNYANLGWKEKIEDGSGNTYSHGINYLQLPLLMQMGWGKERKGVKFVLEAGPQIGYAFSTSAIARTTWFINTTMTSTTALTTALQPVWEWSSALVAAISSSKAAITMAWVTPTTTPRKAISPVLPTRPSV